VNAGVRIARWRPGICGVPWTWPKGRKPTGGLESELIGAAQALMQLESFVGAARAQGASDLHLEPGLPPALRIRGSLKTAGEPVPAKTVLEMAREILSAEQWARFVERRSFD